MAPHSPPTTMALNIVHYIAPIATAIYFLAAKSAAACLLQKPPKRSSNNTRRYFAIVVQVLAALTVAAEGIVSVLQYFRQPGWYATEDYTIYLVLLFAIHNSFALGLFETKKTVWHPYLGSWLLALCFDISIVTLQGLRVPSNGFSKARMAFCITRAALLTLLSLSTSWFILQDRRRSIKLDSESEALLATHANGNGNTNRRKKKKATGPDPSPADSLFPSDTSEADAVETENVGENDSDDDIDSDSEEPERDKELKEQQRARLKAAGSWINYLKEFKIFIPLLLPKKDRKIQACLLTIAVCIIAQRALNILLPRQMGIIVNDLTATAGTGHMPWRDLGLWLLFATLQSGFGISLVKQVVQLPVQQYGYKAISETAFRHIMGLSMDFHNEKNSGELIRAIQQGTNLQDLASFIFFTVFPMFFDLILAFFYVTTLFDIYMTLILFCVGIAYVWVGAKVTAMSVKSRRRFNTAWREESKVQNEAISQWQTVSHFNRGQYESQRYSNTVDKFNKTEWVYYTTWYLGGAAQSFMMTTGRLSAYLLAAYRVSQGRAPIGNLITLIQYWGSIEGPLSSVSFSIRRISSMLTDSERMLQLLTTKPSVVDAPDARELEITAGEVAFNHVSFAYDPRRPTLKDVDFTVKPGQTIALVGETGGGKSTVLKLLYRYYDVSSGSICIDGSDVREVTLDSLRDSFGMVPQDPSLFNDTLMENIRYADLTASDQDVLEACKAAAIHDKIMSFPDGYKAKVGERGVKLSGGELQRVSIARAILRKPKIVLLDEATSMIDAETEAVIQEAFRKLTASRTTFIVAHRLSTIQHADVILVINDGQIVERGTHAELFALNGKYVSLWSKQLNKNPVV
ncbi:Heavy metal tolerance [Lecanosticta acicola]|uniref:Heavy metal tolerance n=1 Tax=Lecanosticta acicola TaxID=111012 RepID=A0AAI8Z3Q8_9PEZI|nr:Heavy metal tolerance [Lecanosticta acicola]